MFITSQFPEGPIRAVFTPGISEPRPKAVQLIRLGRKRRGSWSFRPIPNRHETVEIGLPVALRGPRRPDIGGCVRFGSGKNIVYAADMDNRSSRSLDAMKRNLFQALRRRDFESAEEILLVLKEEDPLAIETRAGELELMILTDRLSEAEKLAGYLVENFPGSARIHYLVGRLHYRARDYTRAAESFDESLRLSNHWQNRRWLGKCLTQLGRFDQAEAILGSLRKAYPVVETDLAWMYERQGDFTRALDCLERHIELFPDDEFSRSARERLRARMMDRDDLIEEIRTLEELEEEIPERILPEYISGLLEKGEIQKVRRIFPEMLHTISATTLTSIGWNCHHAGAPDLAYELFARTLSRNIRSVKFLTALESDARKAGLLPELIELYREKADEHRPLYGRIKRLERWLKAGK